MNKIIKSKTTTIDKSIFETNLYGLLSDSNNNYYFVDLLKTKDKNSHGSFFIEFESKSNVKILVVDDELKIILKSFDYIDRYPTVENIKSICNANQYEFVFELYWCKESLLLKTIVLNNPNI